VELPTTRANLYPSRWQRERIQRAARICRCIERGQAGDKRTIHKMLVRFAWVWKDRHYTCDPSRRIRFSYPTLRSLYYAWKNGGGIPATPETKSFSAAYRKLATPGATESAYRHATPGRLRAAVAALLAHRRHEQVLERAARRILVGVAK
jgi:hypothetical protein